MVRICPICIGILSDILVHNQLLQSLMAENKGIYLAHDSVGGHFVVNLAGQFFPG